VIIVIDHVGFASWAINARVTEHLLICVAKNCIAGGIDPRSLIPMPVGFTSRTGHANVIRDLLV
jgi:hypothetical protein